MSEDTEHENLISRTKKKHDAEAAQVLGERLLDISNKQLLNLNLPENLYDAVQQAKNITAFGGRKRQLQFIGKLMRNTELRHIIDFFDQLDNKNYVLNAKFKNMEDWRDRLILEGNDAVQVFQIEYPMVDAQKLRQLIRNANNKNEKLALKSKRAIFQQIKDTIINDSES